MSKALIDYYPDDEDSLCLHVYPNIHRGWRLALGHNWEKLHCNDIAPGGHFKEGLYRFPFLHTSIASVYNLAQHDNVVFSGEFLEAAKANVSDSIAGDMQMPRLRALEKYTKNDVSVMVNNGKHSRSPFYDRLESKRKPYRHQLVMREFACSLSEFACFAEMGTGKTQALAEALWWRMLRGHITHALVVCPVSILANWEKEINEYTDLSAVALLDPTTKGKLRTLDVEKKYNQVFIVNYESVSGIYEWLDTNLDWNKTFVVADETTKIKNPFAKRSKSLHKIGRKARYKAALTGTPVTQGAWDVYSQFLYLDGGATFGSSYENFKRTYFWSNPRVPQQIMPKPGAIETISEKIYSRGLRFTKDECLDLPDKIYSRRFVKLSQQQKETYERIQIDAIANIEGDVEVTAPIILVELMRLAQITSGHIVGMKYRTETEIYEQMIKDGTGWTDPGIKKTVFFKDQPKIDMLRNMIKDEFSEDNIIVWTRFVPEEKLICDMLEKEKIPYSCFRGKKDRQEEVEKFQKKETRVFVGNPASAGHGLTLTAGSINVYLSNSFSLEQRQQSEDRTHRIGQEKHAQYIDVVVKGSIDERVLDALLDKFDTARQVTRDNFRKFLTETDYMEVIKVDFAEGKVKSREKHAS